MWQGAVGSVARGKAQESDSRVEWGVRRDGTRRVSCTRNTSHLLDVETLRLARGETRPQQQQKNRRKNTGEDSSEDPTPTEPRGASGVHPEGALVTMLERERGRSILEKQPVSLIGLLLHLERKDLSEPRVRR